MQINVNNSHFNSHTDPLFEKSQILKIKDMYEFQTVLFIYDYRAKQLPCSFENVFQENFDFHEQRLTRHADLLIYR